MRFQKNNRKDRGATLVEMSIASGVVFLALFGVIEAGRLLFVHNSLSDATRRAARYAAMNTENASNVKNIAIYGVASPAVGAMPLVNGLSPSQVDVVYNNFGVKQGTVTVRITGYTFKFLIPLVGTTISLPEYKTTLTGEAAGYLPPAM